jgi:hypothetical protein
MAQPAKPVSRIRFRQQPSAAVRRRATMRDQLFPDVSEEQLWNRKEFTGFTTIPRTLSLVLRIVDGLNEKSAGRVYFDLWCRAFDDYFIDVRDEYEFAYSSGYSGQRAIRSWRERMGVLTEHGFIQVALTAGGRYRHVLLLNPHPVIERLFDQKKVSQDDYLALHSYLLSIGAV